MPCNRRNRTFISRTVLVSGQNSAIREQDFYEIGLLPIGGLTNEVLVKCSNRNYHTDWVDISTLIALAVDTDWVETLNEVYNDTKPIGIGTATPFPGNALTILGNFQQDLNLVAGENTFLHSGTGIPLTFYGPFDTATAGGVEDVVATGEYAWFGAANQTIGDHTFNAATKTLTGIGGFDESSIFLDKTGLTFTHINTPPGITDTNKIQIEQGKVTISSNSVTPLAGKFYVFDKMGGMEMQDETATKIYRFPAVDGANLEVLTSDGLGNLFWRANAFTGGTVITADNGLNKNVSTNVRLGGPLLVNTIINTDGASSLTIQSTPDPNVYMFIDDTTVEFSGMGAVKLILSSGIIQVQTADIVAGATTLKDVNTDDNGDVLTLIDKASGEVEWRPYKYTRTFAPGDWIGGQLSIPESVHGMGAFPSVFVVNNETGYQVLPGNSLEDSLAAPVVGIFLNEIKIGANGDITLLGGVGTPDWAGKITII